MKKNGKTAKGAAPKVYQLRAKVSEDGMKDIAEVKKRWGFSNGAIMENGAAAILDREAGLKGQFKPAPPVPAAPESAPQVDYFETACRMSYNRLKIYHEQQTAAFKRLFEYFGGAVDALAGMSADGVALDHLGAISKCLSRIASELANLMTEAEVFHDTFRSEWQTLHGLRYNKAEEGKGGGNAR